MARTVCYIAESLSVEPIDEIDGKKKRRVMLENMQRSSALFQSKIQKTQGKTPEEAKLAEQPPAKAGDTADFSAEFTNQDANLNSDGKADILKNWDDIIEDDDWLKDEEKEEEEEQSEGQGEQGAQEGESDAEQVPPADWKKQPVKGGGFFNSAFGAPSPSKAADASPEEKVEKKLGFEWGPVEQKKASSSNPTTRSAPLEKTVPVALPPSKWLGLPSAVSESDRQRPVGAAVLPVKGQLQQVDSSIVSAARLLVMSPEEEPGYEECIRLLSLFGLGALRLCGRAKVKVHILDEDHFMTFPELAAMALPPESHPVDGAYLVKSKTCLIDRRCLTEKPQFFHPALYYFAHALDHAQGGDDFSSRKAAAVRACFDASCNGYDGRDFVDELAATDPVRYFARSVSIYLGRDDCDSPIWTHQDLYDLDRSMYDYLEYLFARFAL